MKEPIQECTELLEAVAAARTSFECLCHSIFSVFNKGVE